VGTKVFCPYEHTKNFSFIAPIQMALPKSAFEEDGSWDINPKFPFCRFSLVLLLVLREKKAALSCTGKSFALDRGVNPRLISNTDCVFLLILRKNKSMIIQELLFKSFNLSINDDRLGDSTAAILTAPS